ncbi:MAG: hypothetical protein AUJ18_04500 [Candidatus Hydrogenedentes bacterium CG1_02_42_14]|nr:MAG: hypothetical protein AUJ18_04500 [Candidatus Hydrogenedentes bacterium CG1_02_42_14]
MIDNVLYLALVIIILATPACAKMPESAPPDSNISAETVVPVPIHYMTDTDRLIPFFANAIKPMTEYRAIIEMANGKKFEIAFFPETAPNHVANFVSLANSGFYDGVTFHRVIPGFMAQGGDPTGTGMGGPGYTIPAEFSDLPHNRGTVSMARTNDPNSAGSQFFICFTRTPYLDRQYSIFGEVVKEMETVDSIRPRDPQNNPDFRGDAIKHITILETPVSIESDTAVLSSRTMRRNRPVIRRAEHIRNEENQKSEENNGNTAYGTK